jgi:hypothetical protein
MHKIELRPYGVYVCNEGIITIEEMEQSYNESVQILKQIPQPFGIFFDTKDMKTLQTEAGEILKKIEKLYLTSNGFTRAAIIVADSLIKMQQSRIAKESGTYNIIRYFDVKTSNDWENQAINWIVKGIYND